MEPLKVPEKQNVERLAWGKIIFLLYMHYGSIWGLYYLITYLNVGRIFYSIILYFMSHHGTAVGSHRLWAHRSFKAKLPLRIYLAICQTYNFQLDIYNWVRDHRVHHKYSDTESDPHNASRGFFYSHIGWLCYKKSPKVIEKGRELDLSDLLEDPVVRIQRKYYWFFAPIAAFVLPVVIPWYFLQEPFIQCWYVAGILRWCISYHGSSLVNSAAHLYGNKPYDKHILPSENYFVSILTGGEGWHNYHHVFPWDYKTSELGKYYGTTNTMFIDFMAKIGQVYDRKSVSKELIEKRMARTGDLRDKNLWGWEDKNMEEEDMKMAHVE